MRKRNPILGFFADAIFILLATAFAVGNGLDGQWCWLAVWSVAAFFLVIRLTVEVTLYSVGRGRS